MLNKQLIRVHKGRDSSLFFVFARRALPVLSPCTNSTRTRIRRFHRH